MTKLEAALEILFADNLEALERSNNTDKLAELLGTRLFMTDHWAELRQAAKDYLLEHLTKTGDR